MCKTLQSMLQNFLFSFHIFDFLSFLSLLISLNFFKFKFMLADIFLNISDKLVMLVLVIMINELNKQVVNLDDLRRKARIVSIA